MKKFYALSMAFLSTFFALFLFSCSNAAGGGGSQSDQPVSTTPTTPTETPQPGQDTPQPSPNTYTITYNLNGGTNAVENPASYTDGTTVTLADPERLGCDFAGWYEAEDFSGDAVTQLSGRSATLWAKWTLIEYNITYIITNGSDDMQSASTTSGTYTVESELMAAPQKDGYTFKGWFLDTAQTQAVASLAGLTGEQTLYGHWAGTIYRVAYSGIDGATLAQDSAAAVEGFTTEDQTLALPTYEKRHYIFNGWEKEGGSQVKELSASSAAAGSTLTLCAKWMEVEYAVNYDLLFPSGVTNPNTAVTITASTSPQALQDPIYTDNNFVFAGWYKDYQNGTYSNKVTAISVDDVAEVQSTFTLHAKWTYVTPWTPSGATVRVTSMQTAADDIAALTASEEFYLLVTDTSIEGTQFRPVNAALKANTTAKFYFDLSAATTKFEMEGGLNNAPYSFNGCENLSGVTLPECSTFTIMNYALFENCKSLKTIQIPKSVKVIRSYMFKNCNNLETVYLPQSLTEIQGSVFEKCLKLTSAYYNSIYSDLKKIKIEVATSKPTCNGGALYVLNDSKTDWRRVYSISFDKNWGNFVSGYSPPQWFVESENVEFPTAENVSRDGYRFYGWYDNSSYTGTPISSIPNGTNDNLTLWAKWIHRDDTPYKVLHYQENLDDDGYTLVDTDNLEGTTGKRTAAVAKDYVGFTAETFAQTSIKADGTTEVKIYYKRGTVTFTLDLNGGTLDGKTGTITKTDKVGRAFSISNPTKAHAVFAGWNTVGGTLPTTYNANATYAAVWTNIEATPIQITVLPESDISVTKTQSGSVITFTAEECDSYRWTLDDAAKGSSRTCQIDTSTLLKGTYTISLEAKKGGKWRSYYAQIKVK